MGDVAVEPHPHDCQEDGALLGSQRHGRDASREARILHSPACCRPHQLMFLTIWSACAGSQPWDRWQEGRGSSRLRPASCEPVSRRGAACRAAAARCVEHPLRSNALGGSSAIPDGYLTLSSEGSAVTPSPLDVCCCSGPQRSSQGWQPESWSRLRSAVRAVSVRCCPAVESLLTVRCRPRCRHPAAGPRLCGIAALCELLLHCLRLQCRLLTPSPLNTTAAQDEPLQESCLGDMGAG